MKHEHGGRSSGALIDGRKLLSSLNIAEGETLLDAGCGDGYLAVIASGIVGPSGAVYAVDVFEESLARLRAEVDRKGITNLKPIRADITKKIPLSDGAAGVCLLVNVLHGFVVNGEDKRALGEIARVLARAGRLVVVEFKKTAEGAETDSPGPPVSQRISKQETIVRVAPFDLAVESSFEAGPHHYAVVFRKR